VLYSHRSNFLHTLVTLQHDVMGLSVRRHRAGGGADVSRQRLGPDLLLPAVGAKLVMPGPKMDGASILDLLESEGVTFSAAVPTVWQMLLAHLKAHGRAPDPRSSEGGDRRLGRPEAIIPRLP